MTKEFILNDGNSMPLIGYGPGIFSVEMKSSAYCPSIIRRIFNKMLYRPLRKNRSVSVMASAFTSPLYYLDYSFAYGNFDVLRNVISSVGRENLFIVSRINNQSQFNRSVKEDFSQGLSLLGIEYLDLLEFHWPVTGHYEQTWLEMEQFQREGKVKSIGVSNCNIHHLERILQIGSVTPAVNQIEVHPLFTQKEIVSYCRQHHILVQAYTSIARFDERLVRLPLLRDLARKYGKSIPQLILRWHLQNGISPVIRSWNRQRIQGNIEVLDFELTADEMQAIDGVNINSRLRYDPDNCDFSIL